MPYREDLSLEQLRSWLTDIVAKRDHRAASLVRTLQARIRAAEVAEEPGLYQLGALSQLQHDASIKGPQSTAWQALRLLDEQLAQAAWRRYWGNDCQPDGSVVVGGAP